MAGGEEIAMDIVEQEDQNNIVEVKIKNSKKGEITMPRGDGTGPNGMGTMTGRAAGFCAGFNAPGFVNPAVGRGRGMGFGRGRGFGGGGRGFRNRFCATAMPGCMRYGANPVQFQEPNPESEKEYLKNQAKAIESELEAVKKRLGELETV